jgi:glycosyltransferase involved in cell wall biosynthesis
MTSAPLDLAIVTSCSGYGKYLGEWAESIANLTLRPREVAIVTQGAPADVEAAAAATSFLRHQGFHVKLQHLEGPVDFGTARNAAVALSSSEWVCHLDADDMIMPHALEDVARLAPGADVIALGYVRVGDLKAGPRQALKLYKSSTGTGTLDNPTPASGVSPFRRAFWERSPYRTDMTGGWDTALWLGFAHLGARILATDRPCFWYRQHSDSIFNQRRKSGWPAHRVGMKLQSLRRGDSGVALIVPFAPDGGAREEAWDWLQRRYEALVPEWDIRLGTSTPLLWRKGEAIAEALDGCSASVLVIADADCLVPIAALRRGVELVETGRASWVVPHTLVHRLKEDASRSYLERDPSAPAEIPPPASLERPPYLGYEGGGILVVGRSEFEATGGIPREFVGWGAEDEALAVILSTLVGPATRLESDLVHFWHKPQLGRGAATKRGPGYRQNRALYQRLLRSSGDPERLFAAVRGGGKIRLGPYFDPVTRLAETSARALAIRSEAASMIRDSFAERRLAAQHNRRSPMSTALDLKHAHRAARLAQARRNAEHASRSGVTLPPDPPAPATKAILASIENKATLVPGAVKFASARALEVAQGSGLPISAFAGIEPASTRGLTLEQVREVIDR